jgi:hypothetical protein
MIKCKNCEVERNEMYFRTAIVKGKTYYRRNKCRICLGLTEKKIAIINDKYVKDTKLSNKDKVFLGSIKSGLIDMVGCYMLADTYLRYFDEPRIEMSVEDELIYMWEKLKEME